MRFEDAISENDKALAEYRKKPNETHDKISAYKKYNAKKFMVQLTTLFETFDDILDVPPRNLHVVVVGPQRGHIPGLLANGNRVTWFMTGNSTFGSLILEIEKQYPKTFTYIPKSLCEKVRKVDQFKTDIVMVDVNTTSVIEFSAVVSSPLFRSIICNQAVIPKILVYGHVPLQKTFDSILTCTWLTLFKLGAKKWKKQSTHPERLNWIVRFDSFRKKNNYEVLSQLESIWKRILSRSLINKERLLNTNKELDDLFEHVIDIVIQETTELKRITDNRVSLPKSEWLPQIKNDFRCKERPYTPSIHSSMSRQIGFDYKDQSIERFYEMNMNEPNPICHWGQLKLLVSEIEFLFECRTREITTNSVLIYIGAAPGEHINLLIQYFPEIRRWVLVDPSKSEVKRHDKIEIVNTRATNEYIEKLRIKYQEEKVIYINDMRTDTDENTVAKEMILQAKWGIHLRAKALLLKLRFPYLERDGSISSKNIYDSDFCLTSQDKSIVTRNTDIQRDGCFKPGKSKNRDTHVSYLIGEVQPQVFAPSTSTEARLLVFPKNNYCIGDWDVLSFESCMQDFNKRLRMRQDGYNLFDDIPVSDIIGVDDGYECSRMINSFRLIFPNSFNRKIKEALEYLSNNSTTLVSCPLRTMKHLTLDKKFDDELYIRIYMFWKKLWECRISDHVFFVSQKH